MLNHAGGVLEMAENHMGDVSSPARQLAATDRDFSPEGVATPSSPSSVVIPPSADEEWENADGKDERDQVKKCEEEKKRTSDSLPSANGEPLPTVPCSAAGAYSFLRTCGAASPTSTWTGSRGPCPPDVARRAGASDG